jgi:WD repeat and SOF domain-containing protein 1
MTDAQTRKKERRVAHAAPGAHKKEFKPMRKERIVEELE